MAKIKYSALVSDMRNSLNGSTMSKNRYGSYVRNKITPVNPQSVFQQTVRANFGNLSKAWRGLTEAQRASWIKGAVNFPFNDIFGDQKYLSGQALFIKLNANLEKIGQARILTAPAPGDMPSWNYDDLPIVEQSSLSTTDIKIGDSSGFTFLAIPAGFTPVFYMTDPVPAGISFVKNRFRYIKGTASYIGISGSIELEAEAGSYASRFGLPTTGEKIYVRYALVNNATGEQGVPVEFVTVF